MVRSYVHVRVRAGQDVIGIPVAIDIRIAAIHVEPQRALAGHGYGGEFHVIKRIAFAVIVIEVGGLEGVRRVLIGGNRAVARRWRDVGRSDEDFCRLSGVGSGLFFPIRACPAVISVGDAPPSGLPTVFIIGLRGLNPVGVSLIA